MRYIFYGALALILVLIFVPTTLTLLLGIAGSAKNISPLTRDGKDTDVIIKVYMENTKQIVNLKLEDYLKGVVAAEMPAEFEAEALKAQAVASRTYAVKHMRAFGGEGCPQSPRADVSTSVNSSVGQAYLNEAELKAKWGKNYGKYWRKVSAAVDETRGIVLTSNGKLICAVFHSASGDRTASAKEVWGTDYPYLQSVACKWDQDSPRYASVAEITPAALLAKLGGEADIPVYAQGGLRNVAAVLSRTESGRVEKIRIGGKTFTGQEAREKLGLRSANFEIEALDGKLIIKTIGYGHGVGLCQYGANGQAKEGRGFREILQYYYRGAVTASMFRT